MTADTPNETQLMEIVKSGGSLPAAVLSPNWGAISELETTDLLIPKIYHQQANSKFAKDGIARAGDFCDSVTGEILGTKDNGLEVIIFGVYKTMLVSKLDPRTQKFQLETIIQITPVNAKEIASKPFTEEREDGAYKNSLYYHFYCLMPNRMDELPFVLSLGGTKTKAAKKINTIIYNLGQKGRNSASVIFKLSNFLDKNDKGDWFGLEVSQGRNATPEELMRAYAWHVKSKSQTFTVVENEESAAHDETDIPF